MMHITFGLKNPFSDRWANIFNRSWVIAKTKAAEFEIYRDTVIVSFAFRWTIRQDHAGMSVEIGLLGYTASLQYYETRHWNEEAGRFYNYDKSGNAS